MSAATPGGKEPAAAPRLAFADAARVSVGGVIGEGLEASMNGRLKWFIRDERSEAIRVYRRKTAARSPSKGWLGECAGKWLYAASRCLARTGDPVIERHVRRVAGFLVSQQCEDGYLGTYSTADRFCAPGVRRQTFDLWMNGYVMQGLMRAATVLRDRSLLASARRIADLCIRVYRDAGAKIVNAGPFSGMASACVLEHFVDLYDLTGAGKYLDFAAFCLRELDRRPGVEIVRRTTLGYDAAQIGEGKMYEMIRCLVGMAKLARATRDKELCAAVANAWREISAHHLNAAGAPCGGVGGHLECFNVRYAFSPYA
ncbi:hypothetical protein GX586_15660, partial [bacterium]|nr:hypothetical protein [bacterium]